jgi:hypothetical protein
VESAPWARVGRGRGSLAMNARSMRALLLALELMPLALGYKRRFRQLPVHEGPRIERAHEVTA